MAGPFVPTVFREHTLMSPFILVPGALGVWLSSRRVVGLCRCRPQQHSWGAHSWGAACSWMEGWGFIPPTLCTSALAVCTNSFPQCRQPYSAFRHPLPHPPSTTVLVGCRGPWWLVWAPGVAVCARLHPHSSPASATTRSPLDCTPTTQTAGGLECSFAAGGGWARGGELWNCGAMILQGGESAG